MNKPFTADIEVSGEGLELQQITLKNSTDWGHKTNLVENEQHLIARFVRGLRFDIKEKVKLQPFLTLSNAITYAKSVEEIIELNSRKTTRETHGMSLVVAKP